MAKLTVWECDRCTRQVTQPELPTGWMVAATYDGPLVSEADLTHAVRYLWCKECWEQITAVKEQIEQVRALRYAHEISQKLVFRCGHPRGGCEAHCDPLVRVMGNIRAALHRADEQAAPKS